MKFILSALEVSLDYMDGWILSHTLRDHHRATDRSTLIHRKYSVVVGFKEDATSLAGEQ